ncbi:amidohydrolase family protein [Brevibacterium sanguinis]|uniref:Amidohydrolase family protein n=2 Tax=Brevibacterium TaxID=1696 RepID=A0A366IRN7_9MICO|nr:amidohydrolase family protein [Brevibacterium sanguinis]RBP74777.1 amidohydrolase family protein [Brevibacterium celere]
MHNENELLIRNALIRTMDSSDSVHEAVLVRDGRIAAVGAEGTVRSIGSPGVVEFDADGRTVVPGFIDAHNHLSDVALKSKSVDCGTPPLETVDEVLSVVERYCATLPAGRWVRGVGFHFLKVREQRGPTRWELDEVAPDNPLLIKDNSGHASYVNSAALLASGLDECTPNPWGGHIDRDSRGRLTGTLYEAATNWVNTDLMLDYARNDRIAVIELISAKASEYLTLGITGIGDACVTPLISELYSEAAEMKMLPLTVQQLHASDHYFSQQTFRRGDVVD